MGYKYIQAANYSKGRPYGIDAIVPHHTAGKLTAEQIGGIFANPRRKASAHLGIGYDGEIAQFLSYNDRAWATGDGVNCNSRGNDRAIHIEVSNDANDGRYRVSDASFETLVKLCYEIAKEYNLLPLIPGKNLLAHRELSPTYCPGDYLYGKFGELAKRVNEMAGEVTPTPTPVPDGKKSNEEIADEVLAGKWGNGEERRDRLTAAGYDYGVIQTIVNAKFDQPAPVVPARKSNEVIADEVLAGKWGNGEERKDRLVAAGYNYDAIQAIVNAKFGAKPAGKSNDAIANEVIAGKWGNGEERAKRLADAGYDYGTIQSIVNRKLG